MGGVGVLGRGLMIAGACLFFIGLAMFGSSRWTGLRWLGRLPGDLSWKGNGWQIYAPIATSLLLSVLLSLAFLLFSWFFSRGGGPGAGGSRP